jgi:hypothetical protein
MARGTADAAKYGAPGPARSLGEPAGALRDHERELAQVWADALGVPAGRIRADDNFFLIGGTSRTAARLVIALGQQRLSLSELAGNATLAAMAGLLQRRRQAAGAEAAGG